MSDAPRPRLVPDQPLPPYAYVTGQWPHPLRDPAGHSHGKPTSRPEAPDRDRWQACRPYLVGIDLFNHGYYWEAHEAWEGLWLACGRTGLTASFLKGLIQLAAAGFKVREGMPEGVRRHAGRAAELFREVARQLGPGQENYFGLGLEELADFAAVAARQAGAPPPAPGTPAVVVFPFVLRPIR
jgi:predicted metal-dependent hydrolase